MQPMKPQLNYFAIGKALVQHQHALMVQARAELAHMITVYGPIEVAKAAKIGLQQRDKP